MKVTRFENPRFWWVLWSLFNSIIAVIALYSRKFVLGDQVALLWQSVKPFTVLQWLALTAPVVTALLILSCHCADCRGDGRGIQARLRRVRGSKYATDATFVSAAITKQSVIVAISIGTLLMVASEAEGEASTFRKAAASVAIVGLVCSIVFTLVSILCYDYSVRFEWHRHFREHLLRKGLKIEVLGWYVLTLSFVLAINLLSATLSLVVNCLYGSLLLYYYFPEKFYDRKEQFWGKVDTFLCKNKFQLEIVSLHRAHKHNSADQDNLWNLEVIAPSVSSRYLFTIREQSYDDDLTRKLWVLRT